MIKNAFKEVTQKIHTDSVQIKIRRCPLICSNRDFSRSKQNSVIELKRVNKRILLQILLQKVVGDFVRVIALDIRRHRVERKCFQEKTFTVFMDALAEWTVVVSY